jgi:hypothetical protein
MVSIGVQFTGTLGPNETTRWFTHSWSAQQHVIWYMMPTSPQPGAPQVEWNVEVERASSEHVTYWITVRNVTSNNVNFEARYAILN